MQNNLAFANAEFNSLNSKNQQAVFSYISALAKRQKEKQLKRRNAFGILKGRKFYMSKDFNKPLDDFEEYY